MQQYVENSVFFKYWRVIFTLLSNELCNPAIPKINACCLTLAISHFVPLSQPLFVPCLFEKSIEKASVERKAFNFRIIGVHSSLGKRVWKIWIDNYAKDGVSGEVWHLCSFDHKPLFTWIKANVNKFAILSHTVLKLGTQNLGSYLRLTCEHELDIVSNTKVSLAKDHYENYMKLRLFLACHLLRNRLFLFLRISK